MTAPEYLIRLAVLLVGWETEALRVAAERAVEQAQVQTRDFSAGPAVAVPVPPTDPGQVRGRGVRGGCCVILAVDVRQ